MSCKILNRFQVFPRISAILEMIAANRRDFTLSCLFIIYYPLVLSHSHSTLHNPAHSCPISHLISHSNLILELIIQLTHFDPESFCSPILSNDHVISSMVADRFPAGNFGYGLMQ
eukprot:Sdes_comp20666_c0_seq1m16000